MDATKKCYEDTLRMAEVYRNAGNEEAAKKYEAQAEIFKRQMEERANNG